ncbi:MAG: hypothetical protein IGS39_04990 [Calothrix sp. C42_A2020_038]|nr:hypothetical protein [Calothrix sp. C42_A2020_038]
MKLPKLTPIFTFVLLPLVMSSFTLAPVNANTPRNPLKKFSNQQVLKQVNDTVCENYVTNRTKDRACIMLTTTGILRLNKLKFNAIGVNFRNSSQRQSFVIAATRILTEDRFFSSALRVASRDLTGREQADILHRFILYYGMLQKAGYH